MPKTAFPCLIDMYCVYVLTFNALNYLFYVAVKLHVTLSCKGLFVIGLHGSKCFCLTIKVCYYLCKQLYLGWGIVDVFCCYWSIFSSIYLLSDDLAC